MPKVNHPYHMVNFSPWPLLVGLSVFMMVIGLVNYFVFNEYMELFSSLVEILLLVGLWWRDVTRESVFQGYHSSYVISGLMMGMILFIISEIFFFISFFWTFFHSSLNSCIELGDNWPPSGVNVLDPFQVPLLNTIILLSSGVSITWCHQKMLMDDWGMSQWSLMLTWILGIYFLMLQGVEYLEVGFGISDSVFGSIFFMSTGFHGFHVFIGTLFLIIMMIRMLKGHFSVGHHLGFEFAAWYWHFVDVVWLFLFSVVYWWGTL